MENKKRDTIPIVISIVIVVFVVIYTGCMVYNHIGLQHQRYNFNRNIERVRDLKPGSFNIDEIIQLNKEERQKYLNERKLK